MYDYLIVGCGLFGSTFARLKAEQGKSVKIVEKRNHIGGNCYTEKKLGIDVHVYGPHCFHTNSRDIWYFVNRFAVFNHYIHRIFASYKGKSYSIPINLLSLQQVWGITNPEEIKQKINSLPKTLDDSNVEGWVVNNYGKEIYEIFVKGYTKKQWGIDPKNLPSNIIKRLPFRTTYNDRYFNDKYEGVPINGYTSMFEKMLDHELIDIELNVDFFENKKELLSQAKQIVYTGKIDQFYDYKYGHLEYRSLRFEEEVVDGDYQGCSIVNYTDENVPYTRIVEHKHFTFNTSDISVITKEYPEQYDLSKIPYYPIGTESNIELYNKYKSENSNVIFGGRLGTYKYLDMDQTIGQAMQLANKL